MKPPFKITSYINNRVAEISKLLGALEATTLVVPNPKLRRKNRIKTIKSTLAIEGHTFTEEQITAVIEGKRVLGTEKELLEVQNVIKLYDQIDDFKSHRSRDLLKAHKILMTGLIATAGKFRSKNVGVLAGSRVKHLAPKPAMVPALISRLFRWSKAQRELHPLILSSILHYEIEYIHPFEDGNGRMGRFWQALILTEHDQFFKYVPMESLIEKNQSTYYEVLAESDNAGDSTAFVEFMLKIIKKSLEEVAKDLVGMTKTFEDRIEKANVYFRNKQFSRKDYMELFRDISTATANRDLRDGAKKKILRKDGEGNKTVYHF